MKIRMLAGAACAALTVLVAPASAATNPALPIPQTPYVSSSDQAVAAFYASRAGRPLWLRNGADSTAARQLIEVLRRAPLDGLASGPVLAAQAQSLIARAQTGDPAALAAADRLLSAAWIAYVRTLQAPAPGMTYADSWVRPRQDTPMQILMRAAGAPSLASHVRTVSNVNPIYAQLREAAWLQGQVDARIRANLDRARSTPFQKRYIVVDVGSARLYMIDGNQIVDSMKVIVGKASTQTPMLASTIYYATLNPYWNVPPDLVRRLTAAKVLQQGLGYLKSHGYQVIDRYGDEAQPIDPATVDWKAVAEGRATVAVRQLPGPANSMGRMKFGFPNAWDIYLHDTPQKELFAQADRDLSNGCIRVEDAQRLGRWLLGRDPAPRSSEPEQHALLPTPVPIYVTYLTAQAEGGQLSFVDDPYGLDRQQALRVSSLR